MENTFENKIAIYSLVDPREPNLIRYIGQTEWPRIRHLQHCKELNNSKKNQWVESLVQNGILPQMIILEWVKRNEANEIERKYIEKYKNDLLTNTKEIKENNSENETNISQIESNIIQIKTNSFAESERKLIESKLIYFGFNKSKTARELGIGRQTLYNKIKRYKISINSIKKTS